MAKKKDITREEILLAAYRSWMARGYHGTGLRELASEVGFTIASLLHRFQSKERMMGEVIHHCRDCWNTSLARLNAREMAWEARWEALLGQLSSAEPQSALLLAVLAAESHGLPASLQGAAREAQGTLEGWIVRMLLEAKRRGEWAGDDAAAFARETLRSLLGQQLLDRLK
jgi:AcrR family transcriptional regulator